MCAVEQIMDLDVPQQTSLATSTRESKPSVQDFAGAKVKQAADAVSWGRTNSPKWLANIGATGMIAFCPIWMWMNWAALEHFNGSLTATIRSVYSIGPRGLTWQDIPSHSHVAAVGYMA